MKFKVLAVLVLLFATVFAGERKKQGYDLYWKNKIALASDDAVVVDELVPEFLTAPEGFQTDSKTGELVTGSQRRTYSPDHQMGWVLTVNKSAEVKSEKGEIQKLYSIETQLVFDLRQIEKK